MADAIFDYVPSSDSSPLNKLPTKRIDAAISAARDANIPEQGEQSGGYTTATLTFRTCRSWPYIPTPNMTFSPKRMPKRAAYKVYGRRRSRQALHQN
jgi:hypothetical protein